MFELDIHTHSVMSGHAYGTIREMAKVAQMKGLKLLGISEHGPGIPGTCAPIYFSNLAVAPRQQYGVELIYGCEINVLNDGTLSLQNHLECLDYAIIGIHTRCYKDEGAERNTENMISCMKHKKVFFISHPDDDHTPLDYERLVFAAKKNHIALELNNSSLLKQDKRRNCVANYKKMLSLCQEYQVPIIVSSDAHDPEYVGRFTEAICLLEEIEFDKNLILNTSVERFKDFIQD